MKNYIFVKSTKRNWKDIKLQRDISFLLILIWWLMSFFFRNWPIRDQYYEGHLRKKLILSPIKTEEFFLKIFHGFFPRSTHEGASKFRSSVPFNKKLVTACSENNFQKLFEDAKKILPMIFSNDERFLYVIIYQNLLYK